MAMSAVTARQANMAGCHLCGLVSRLGPGHGHACPRCGTALHQRKTNSVARAWALVIAAVIMYLPANLLPITSTTTLGKVQQDTIMSGVLYFLHHGDWPIALIIFVASVMVPLLKLVFLCYLLFTVGRRSDRRPQERTRLYRITEAVGKWSMVDVFVVTLLAALVQLGALVNIAAGPAAVSFAGVVILTLLAAHAFDPRLIWDPVDSEETHGRAN